jgi:hypothetical protein
VLASRPTPFVVACQPNSGNSAPAARRLLRVVMCEAGWDGGTRGPRTLSYIHVRWAEADEIRRFDGRAATSDVSAREVDQLGTIRINSCKLNTVCTFSFLRVGDGDEHV